MFNKVLIANRGEIAVRVTRSCHQLGVSPVAVYSEVDASAMHVRLADEAYCIGPAAPAESYLNQDVIIKTALESKCEAIHPGYGFLAENPVFAENCRRAGIVFIGPSSESIKLLGNKVHSRIAMAKAGVPIIPGLDDPNASDEDLKLAAEKIGFPVLVKAAAGGGGKGMRVVYEPENLQAALDGARREAKSAFGDATVYLEKFLIEPRHIEFQIFGDKHGNYVHLFERECSIQRRHQKIIEETPSPALNDDLRKHMGEAAVRVAKTANYFNAGTVEFLLDKDKRYYFLEVNTRIQVEHPITEEVCGVDLVAAQMIVASGGELPWKQSDIKQRGSAIECRIYAEDAAAGFLPAAGPALFVKPPQGPGIRFDGGVETGDEVSVYYDPIVAKLVAYAQDRATAIQRMLNALQDTVVLGFTTNIEFLRAVLKQSEFIDGNLHIGFLAQYMPDWTQETLSTETMLSVLTLSSLASDHQSIQDNNGKPGIPEPWQLLGRWELSTGASR